MDLTKLDQNASLCLITLHGFPAATQLSGMSFVTIEPAPIMQFFPIITGFVIIVFIPIKEFSPI